MSKTISFVASDELVDFLEQEAEDRMTTISSTAQMLLAEKARETMSETSSSSSSETSSSSSSETSPYPSSYSDDDPLKLYNDGWYKPDGKHPYAVRDPDVYNENGGTRYYDTADGARERLREWYE